jgi:glycerol-3-phosphate cytidylyltransferase-like family protein
MSEKERREVIRALRVVDEVVISRHGVDPDDMSVCEELRALRPHIFANGGDRKKGNVPEVGVCKEIGCKMVFGVGKGGKVQSSSWLLGDYIKKKTGKKGKK